MPFGGGFRRGGFRRDFGPRTMTKITCSSCGKEDEVPFKPREGSSVLCKECFMKSKGIKPREKQESTESEAEKKPVKKAKEETDEAEEELEEPSEETEESSEEEY